jgi:hypothetical protein
LIKNQPEIQSLYRWEIFQFKHWKCLLQGIENKTKTDVIKSLKKKLSVYIMQNFSCGSGWCGNGSDIVRFDINLASSVTAVRE